MVTMVLTTSAFAQAAIVVDSLAGGPAGGEDALAH